MSEEVRDVSSPEGEDNCDLPKEKIGEASEIQETKAVVEGESLSCEKHVKDNIEVQDGSVGENKEGTKNESDEKSKEQTDDDDVSGRDFDESREEYCDDDKVRSESTNDGIDKQQEERKHQEISSINKNTSMVSELLHLNVGGRFYITTRSTLLKYPDSMIGAMFGGGETNLEPTLKDENGRYFIDRDGDMFGYVLNYLRNARLSLPEDFTRFAELQAEADYYQIPGLSELVESAYETYSFVKNQKRGVKDHESGDFVEIRETHYGRSKDYREQMERVHMMFIGRWSYINEFRVFLQSSRLADGTEGLPGVQCMIYGDYCEMSWTSEEQYFRIKLGDYLSRVGWTQVESSVAASACEYYNYRTNAKIDGAVQKIFRDRWFKPHTKQ